MPSSMRRPGKAVGLAAYLRIEPGAGVIEVGNITYSPQIQRQRGGRRAEAASPGLTGSTVFDGLSYRSVQGENSVTRCNAWVPKSRGTSSV